MRTSEMKQFNYLVVIFLSTLMISPWGIAEDAIEIIKPVKQQWAHINFQLSGKQQEEGFEQLIKDVDLLTKQHSDLAEVWIWSGIVKSSFAGAKGGLGALSLAKSAKKDLEKSLSIDAKALNGAAYMSLGTLYHKVPGWPIGFGDDDKADEYLKLALELYPNGKETNYFYGEYLYDERKYAKANEYLMTAHQIPVRENRRITDEFRQTEIDTLIEKVGKRLKKLEKRHEK